MLYSQEKFIKKLKKLMAEVKQGLGSHDLDDYGIHYFSSDLDRFVEKALGVHGAYVNYYPNCVEFKWLIRTSKDFWFKDDEEFIEWLLIHAKNIQWSKEEKLQILWKKIRSIKVRKP